MIVALGVLGAYLIGSIPFALLMVKLLTGVDVRSIGSGNVGASNAARAFGKRGKYPAFVLVYLLDFAKGYLPAAFGPGLCLAAAEAQDVVWPIVFGTAAILGHCTSPFLGFKGGKGVATATGVVFVLTWQLLLLGIGAYFVAMLLFRQAFLGSFALVATLVVGVIVRDPKAAFAGDLPLTVFYVALFFFLLYTHRSNIQKFMNSKRSRTA